jgi:hypothetical protein
MRVFGGSRSWLTDRPVACQVKTINVLTEYFAELKLIDEDSKKQI